ncbi:MAG: phosphatase PAP2 family protein [Bacteroidales bacterium]|nr:phosphatase PAP2 family protein [Bacteroidales bacterium]
MLQFLNDIDTRLFLFLNGFHSPFWDTVMWWISGKIQWLPLYLVLIGWMIYRYKWKTLYILLFVIVLITLSDQGSVKLFKDVFQRLRPCHTPEIQQFVHIVNNKCGGSYGFISSHAANSFALAMFTTQLFKNKIYTYFIFSWALIVSYSRIYLGVHYPGDILGGAAWGICCGLVVFYLYTYIVKKTGQKTRN